MLYLYLDKGSLISNNEAGSKNEGCTMNNVFLLLGANIGEPAQQLKDALQEINETVGKITLCSSIYETEAWGVTDQPKFLNQVIKTETSLSPLEVLDEIHRIEEKLGRIRLAKWGARVIDVDILYFNEMTIEHEQLIVPHLHLADRKFALIPLCEIAPEYIHPVLQISNAEILKLCNDPLNVYRYQSDK
ncbi:2-amino-4-hydroxy-6-hydroxymethyldihydropteridine diphosphokinase [Sphingobacterium shayense]|uniref:2-amino-4-hydroxy-6- hydroxymethyldihydropteridine diphosphokinase n=1 Tax=Sphingobacterium shayense TaxID=626343 RepID=UPI001FE4EBC5|nr:2-amino-4-hydroxy-6-hydroxymethyldihydropteridine diphosphokinase [Sphingobacterium shayense]